MKNLEKLKKKQEDRNASLNTSEKILLDSIGDPIMKSLVKRRIVG